MFKLALMLHVLAATIWAGGHLVLSLAVLPSVLRNRDVKRLEEFEAGYERIGVPALLIQIVTGLWLGFRLVPNFADWFSFETPVSNGLALKLLLLLITVLLALHARLRILPRLTERSLPVLAWHIITVTVVAVLFVLVGVGFRTGGFP